MTSILCLIVRLCITVHSYPIYRIHDLNKKMFKIDSDNYTHNLTSKYSSSFSMTQDWAVYVSKKKEIFSVYVRESIYVCTTAVQVQKPTQFTNITFLQANSNSTGLLFFNGIGCLESSNLE